MTDNIWELYDTINSSFQEEETVDSNFDKDRCLSCNEFEFLINDGEMIVCTNCGVENKRIIDHITS